MADTKGMLNEQNKNASQQRFETTFFNILNLHNDLTDGIKSKNHSGRQTFAQILIDNQFGFSAHSRLPLESNTFEKLKHEYEDQFMKDAFQYFSHYIESLNSVYVWIRDSHLVESDAKKTYYNILISTISIAEKSFLLYHLSLAPKIEAVLNLSTFQRTSRFLSTIPDTVLMHSTHKGELLRQIN